MTGGSGGAGAILSSPHFPTAGMTLTVPLQMVLRLSPLHFCRVLKEKKQQQQVKLNPSFSVLQWTLKLVCLLEYLVGRVMVKGVLMCVAIEIQEVVLLPVSTDCSSVERMEKEK